jgi:DMSO/TMAO reductase YedYZ molybdopterin-dependent catalytic subunit
VTPTRQAPAAGEPAAAETDDRGPRRLLAALAGLLSAAVALGTAALAAGLVGPASSPVVAVGDSLIPLIPEPVKDIAIRTFGANDKLALVIGILIAIGLLAIALGLVGLRSRRLAVAVLVLFGPAGVVAAVTRPSAGPLDGVPSLVGAVAGAVALFHLLAPLTATPAERPSGTGAAGGRAGVTLDRRRFLLTSGVALGVAAVAGGGGRMLQRRFEVADARRDLTLPSPASPSPRLPAGADLADRVHGVTPLFTRNPDFYRVDTAITVPQIRPGDYRLDLTGLFDSPRSYGLRDLLDRDDVIERDITLTCVSNEVGGALAGTARWLGVPLAALLRENGVRAASSQLVCRSADGMTIGAPTRSALEVDDAMLAFGMNGEPLPVQHGFPVRMLIPGLYGYVSACKWLTRIEASTYDAFDAYWVARGWSADGPIKVASRIDTPAPLRSFRAGRRPIAGVAWAQTRGIARVEVNVDDGDWTPAQLSPEVDADVWRQWVLPYDFRPGRHQVTVRATTADGEVQTDARTEPFPNGSTGRHSIRVTAT